MREILGVVQIQIQITLTGHSSSGLLRCLVALPVALAQHPAAVGVLLQPLPAAALGVIKLCHFLELCALLAEAVVLPGGGKWFGFSYRVGMSIRLYDLACSGTGMQPVC